MKHYDNQFKKEAVKLSDEIGTKKAAEQLGLPYYTIAEWRKKRSDNMKKETVESGDMTERERVLFAENMRLKQANEILKDALGFFAEDRKR
jgi:transposase